MLVKRYWRAEWQGIMTNHIETEEFEEYEDALKYIFQYKLAGACDGYEIMDLTEQEYYDLKANHTNTNWQKIQDSITERWYDKSAMTRTTIGGNTMRNNMGWAFSCDND